MTSNKCVIVIDSELPVGIIANTAAVLSLTLGKQFPSLIGHELKDNRGDAHHGITTVPIPILKGSSDSLKMMRKALKQHESELTVVDLISATQTTRSYQEYAEKFEETPVDELEYLGIALYGPQKMINKLTGSLGLLR